jgi:hypothetical protein
MIIFVIETGTIVLSPATEDKLFQIGIIGENVGQRIKLARTVRGVVMKNSEWRARNVRWWGKQQRPVEEEIPDEVRKKWEVDARTWVDGMIKIEEEQ